MATDTINDRISACISELKCTDVELARQVGVSKQAIGDWKKGRVSGIKPEHLVNLADALGVEIRWLATGVGQKMAKDPPSKDFNEAVLALRRSDSETISAVKHLLTQK